MLLCMHSQRSSGHENVIRLQEQRADDNFVYIVMTLCDETLPMRMDRGALREHAARDACLGLANGLAFLYGLPEAVTHRDLKPSNLLFKGDCLKRVPGFARSG